MINFYEYLTSVMEFFIVRPVLFAVTAFFGFALLALMLDRICGRMVARLFSRTDGATTNRVIELMRVPIILTVTSVGMIVSLQIVGLGSAPMAMLADAIRTALIVVWAVLLHRLFVTLTEKSSNTSERKLLSNAHAAQMLGNVTALALFFTAIFAILLTWDINVSGLAASAGILGIALSFAAQETLSNLFAGVSILADRPYAIGDYIVLDSGERGQVTDIGLRSTRIRTRDDVGVTIPNGVIARAKILNENAGLKTGSRIKLKVGIAYSSDARVACTVLTDVANRHNEIMEFPEARVRLRQYGESSLDFEVLCWIRWPADRGRITHELLCDIHEALPTHGLEIPFPQRSITIKQQHSG